MKLLTRDDPKTFERLLVLRISKKEIEMAALSETDLRAIYFCENDGSISSVLLAMAIMARRIEKGDVSLELIEKNTEK